MARRRVLRADLRNVCEGWKAVFGLMPWTGIPTPFINTVLALAAAPSFLGSSRQRGLCSLRVIRGAHADPSLRIVHV